VVVSVKRMQAVQHRARYRAVEGERKRLARDLHDTVEQSVVAVRLQIDAAIAELTTNAEQNRNALAHVSRGVELLGQVSTGMRNAIFALRNSDARTPELSLAVSQSAGRLLRGTDLTFELVTTGRSPLLTPQQQQQIVFIVEEALTNAIKHAEAKALTVSMEAAAKTVKVKITDDGRGFDSSVDGPSGHYGLVGMRERARQIGASMGIDSAPGKGTTVWVELTTGGTCREQRQGDTNPAGR